MNYDGEVKLVGSNVNTNITVGPYSASVTGARGTSQTTAYSTTNAVETESLDLSVNGDFIDLDLSRHGVRSVDSSDSSSVKLEVWERSGRLVSTIELPKFVYDSYSKMGFTDIDIYKICAGQFNYDSRYYHDKFENYLNDDAKQYASDYESLMLSGLTDYDGNPINVSSLEELYAWADAEEAKLKSSELGFLHKCFVTGEETYPCGNDEVLKWVTTNQIGGSTEINLGNNLYGTNGLKHDSETGFITIYSKVVPGDVPGEFDVVGYYISSDNPPKPRGPYDSPITFDDYMKVNEDVYEPILAYIENPTEPGEVIIDTTVNSEYTGRMGHINGLRGAGELIAKESNYYSNYEYKYLNPYYDQYDYWDTNFDTSFMDGALAPNGNYGVQYLVETKEENAYAIYGVLMGEKGFSGGTYKGISINTPGGIGMYDQFFWYYNACTPEKQAEIQRNAKIIYNESGADGLYQYFYDFIEHNYNMIPALEQARLEGKDSLFWSTLGLVPDKFGDCLETINQAVTEAIYGDDPVHKFIPNDTYELRYQIMSEIIVNRYGEAAGAWYGFAVEGMNLTVDVVVAAISQVTTGTPLPGVILTRGVKTFSDTYKSAYDRGLSIGACWAEALVVSSVECYFSNLAMSLMINGNTITAAALSEAGETTFEMVVTEVVDIWLGGENSMKELAIKQLVENGYDPATAEAMYNCNFVDSLIKNAGVAFAMSFCMKAGISFGKYGFNYIKSNWSNWFDGSVDAKVDINTKFNSLPPDVQQQIMSDFIKSHESEGLSLEEIYHRYSPELEMMIETYADNFDVTTATDNEIIAKVMEATSGKGSLSEFYTTDQVIEGVRNFEAEYPGYTVTDIIDDPEFRDMVLDQYTINSASETAVLGKWQPKDNSFSYTALANDPNFNSTYFEYGDRAAALEGMLGGDGTYEYLNRPYLENIISEAQSGNKRIILTTGPDSVDWNTGFYGKELSNIADILGLEGVDELAKYLKKVEVEVGGVKGFVYEIDFDLLNSNGGIS